MHEPDDQSITAKADAAFRQAAAKVVRLARQTGTPVIIWDHDRVRAISPDEALEQMTMSAIAPPQPITSPASLAAPPLADVYRMDIDESGQVADLLKAERVELIDGLLVERGIVRLIDRQVEVRTGPRLNGYSLCVIFGPGQSGPVVIDGVEFGQIAVAEIPPRIAPPAEGNRA